METIKQIFFQVWRTALIALSLGLVAYWLYFGRLGSLVPGYSSEELTTYAQAADWHHIAANPVNAPYTVVVWLFTAVLHHNALVTRMVAAGFAVLIALLFYGIIRQWYSFRIAFLGTLLFATSSGFLHFARLGTGQILQMSALAFIAFLVWYQHERRYHKFVGYGLAAVLALLWYVPGMVWFELLGLIVLSGRARIRWRHTPTKHMFGWAAVFLVVLLPLGAAGVENHRLLLTIGGLPQNLHTMPHIFANLRAAIVSVSVHSGSRPLLTLSRAPLLTAAELALGILGVYGYWYHDRSARALMLTGFAVISLALMSLGGGVGIASLIPLLYLFIIHGLRHLLGRWLVVFPRNPIAKFTGIAAVCAMLFFSVLYQVRTYFVAWPHSTATLETFNLQQPR